MNKPNFPPPSTRPCHPAPVKPGNNGGGVTPSVPVAKIPTSIVGSNANASVEAEFFINRQPGPISNQPRFANAAVTVSGNGFDDRLPKFTVEKIEVYEAGKNKLLAEVIKPELQYNDVMGRGIARQTYAVRIPEAKVTQGNDYIFVVTTGINSDPAKKVRTEPVKLDAAY